MAGIIGNLRTRIFTPNDPQYDNNDPRNWGAAPSYEDAVGANSSRQVPDTSPQLTPYLGMRSRLSQVWLNRWTVLLLLIVVRVVFATMSLDSDLESARDKAFSACTGVESMGSAMASMPHYMSRGVNDITAKSIEAGVQALQGTLMLMITGVQEIVVFVVNMLVSTYVCLITLAIKGSVGVMVDALKEITDFVNNNMEDMFNEIEEDAKSVQDVINKATDALESIPGFFGEDLNIPDVKLPSLDKLKDGLTIPDDFKKKLDDLENKIPTFDEVKDAASDAIRIPFQLVAKKVNESLGTYEFDRSVFPIPQKEKLTFCSDEPIINNFFDNLKAAVLKVKNIIIGLVAALAVLVMVPMAYREWRMYRSTRRRAYMLSDPSREFDPVDVVYIASRPHSSIFGLKMAKHFQSNRRQVLVRWAVSYVTSPAALFVLSLGLAGLFSVLCQYALLKQVESRAPALAAEIGEFAGIVVEKLDDSSKRWAVMSNEALNTTNAELNEELFGWVKEGTDSLNDTLNTFVDKMHDGVDGFLGKSPLGGAVKDVLNCLITLKIKGIQRGLTWAHDHAHITFPQVPEDTFSVGALESLSSDEGGSASFLSDPESMATDKITDVVVKLTKKWQDMIMEEAIISAVIVCVWLLLCIIALIRTAALWFGQDLNRGEGGDRNIAPQGHLSVGRPQLKTVNEDPVFPTFGPSPNTPYPPPSPEEYPNEKVHMGTVNSGQATHENPFETVDLGRESYYPSVGYKR